MPSLGERNGQHLLQEGLLYIQVTVCACSKLFLLQSDLHAWSPSPPATEKLDIETITSANITVTVNIGVYPLSKLALYFCWQILCLQNYWVTEMSLWLTHCPLQWHNSWPVIHEKKSRDRQIGSLFKYTCCITCKSFLY